MEGLHIGVERCQQRGVCLRGETDKGFHGSYGGEKGHRGLAERMILLS
jgi:hypothetical protein